MPSGHTEKATINKRRPLTDNMRAVLARIGDAAGIVPKYDLTQSEENGAKALEHRGLVEWTMEPTRGYVITSAGRALLENVQR